VSRTAAGVALAILFLVCLLTLAPARLVDSFLPGDKVIMQGYGGTVWRGSANRALLATGSGYIHLGRVHWSLSPLSLLTLSPEILVESSWGRQRISSGVRITGPEALQLTNLDVLISVQLLRQFLPLAVSGDFSIQVEHLLLENGLPSSGSGRVIWQNAAWQSAQGALSLGSYAIDFRQRPGEALTGDIVTLTGAVRAKGQVELLGKNYSLDILISSNTGLDTQLEQALSLIAQPVPEGRMTNRVDYR